MWTYRARRAIATADRRAVDEAIAAVVQRLWGDRSRTVLAEERVDAIADDVWLTWRIERAGPNGTRVTLLLEELEAGPDPTKALEHVLDLVARRARVTAG